MTQGTRYVAVGNNRGGSGKSTTISCIAAQCALNGQRVLYVDLTLTDASWKSVAGGTVETNDVPLSSELIVSTQEASARAVHEKFDAAATKYTQRKLWAGALGFLMLPGFDLPVAAFWACIVVSAIFTACAHLVDRAFRSRYSVANVPDLTFVVPATSRLCTNLSYFAGGKTLKSAAMSGFDWKALAYQWKSGMCAPRAKDGSAFDVVFFDVDNTIDDLARFAFAMSDCIVVPTSLAEADFRRLEEDPRNGSLFDELELLPADLKPTHLIIVANRLRVSSNTGSGAHFGVSEADRSALARIEALFEGRPTPHLSGPLLMRELPASVARVAQLKGVALPFVTSDRLDDKTFIDVAKNVSDIAEHVSAVLSIEIV
jgi:cellulose biosynthesis protein BcsQ